MPADARSLVLASQARRVYVEALSRGLPVMVHNLGLAVRALADAPAEYALQVARRDAMSAWLRCGTLWQEQLERSLRQALLPGGALEPARPLPDRGAEGLSLVDDDTIEREITASRLVLAMMDKASWEFSDLRSRMQRLEDTQDVAPQDVLRAQVLARHVLEAWRGAGLGDAEWKMLQAQLNHELALLLGEAYHETNRWLIAKGVMPEVDLRPFIRRATSAAAPAPAGTAAGTLSGVPIGATVSAALHGAMGAASAALPAGSGASRAADQVMAQLQRVLSRQVPEMVPARRASDAGRGGHGGGGTGSGTGQGHPLSGHGGHTTASPRLQAAIGHVQEALQRQSEQISQRPAHTAPQALDEIRVRNQALKQVLKQAADSPAERATIEIVALLFQSILTEERIPPSVRVWFARLQMPVLRVAITEPDFFASADHPARRLIDRMGACVMGFSSGASEMGDALEREIKRVVQVVEAYPDTGRRVFQTVLTEFEKFLDHYFQQENQASRKGVSLAQQIEQRETLAIQYTIELRKMLAEVPVQDGVRDFLFQVWADVLAVTAVRSGVQSESTKTMRRAAADLIWSASAKVSREDRAEVIRRLPPLLKTLRDGMGQAGLSVERQDEHIRALNNALAAAFTAKAAVIPRERLDELMGQLETLEAMLPSTESGELSEALVRDLSSHECEDLEVVAEGGTPPTPAMLAWARELQVGGWYMLDYRGRAEPMQLAWRGMRHQLTLFVSPQGRGVLFQLSRLAAFLQAGLLLPAQEEALTVKATRNALAKLEVDPSRLLN